MSRRFVTAVILALMLPGIIVYAASTTQSLSLIPGNTWQAIACDPPAIFVQDALPAPGTKSSGRCDLPLIEGVPVCTDHDSTRWHGLVKRNADNSIACTYGHTHMDDPRVLDGLFGPLAQEISYPWETHNSETMVAENVAKHNFYDWQVVQVPVCRPSFSNLGITRGRLEAHADTNAGVTVRFHSYFIQAEGCDPADPSWHGKITAGGHMDFGHLEVQTSPGVFTHIPLPGDESPLAGTRRLHGGITAPLQTSVWYGATAIVGIGIGKEPWGQVDQSNPVKVLRDGGKLNGSLQQQFHLVTLLIPTSLDAQDGKTDGRVTFHGLSDRAGRVVPACAPLGSDCVPLNIDDMKVGYYQFRADDNGIPGTDYDVVSPVTGKSLITFPN